MPPSPAGSPPRIGTPRQRVAVETPQHSGLDGVLDYAVEAPLPAGTLLRVPLGKRIVTGIVWDEATQRALTTDGGDGPAEAQLRAPVEAWTELAPLPAAWRRLVDFTAGYYQRSVGEVALTVLPPELRQLDAIQLARRLKRLHRDLSKAATAPAAGPPPRPQSTPEQAAALAELSAAGPGEVSLLYGATGSGKTEVYLQLVDRVLEQGGQALVLVPEINLTPQLLARFRERFAGRRVVELHSGLTAAQRLQNWLQAHLGHADVVLGTRLAVFTPLARLGLIVVDEEHEPSFKQQEGARYSARDLAVYRARLEGVPALLGSATPSLESWHNALPKEAGGAGRYRLVRMPSRIGGGALPRVRLVDLEREKQARRANDDTPLAHPLLAAIEERRARGEQSLVLLNRRGYAPVLHCGDCGWKSGCPHCSAWRVFHKADRTLRCHHCGFSERVPRACPECGNQDIRPIGRGTEKLEEQLAAALPGARVGRIDADVTKKAGALEAQLASVHAGEVDVLVGTQMVAKGHDFRRITLVAAVNPDGALFSSDFRAAERQFALLLQAAGRAGRDAEAAGRSEMWVQTWHPMHPLYGALVRHDFESFAAGQLEERQGAGLPPYTHLALLRADARTQETAQAFLQLAREASQAFEGVEALTVYPPVPTPVARVANVERAQMLVEARNRVALQRLLAAWMPQLHELAASQRRAGKPVLRWAVDVDPLQI
ncbi:MAG: primosomal protein N' [Aquabacterium sp.]|nr:MAG: primosomal protein N' [Aquabacterium sp.]